MTDSQVVAGELKKKPDPKKLRRGLLIGLGIIIFLTPGSVLLARHYIRNRNAGKTDVNVAVPALKPAEFVESQKDSIAKSDASTADKINQRTTAANYYSNIYDFEKVVSELELVAKDFPEASNNHFYLLSYFIAVLQLNRTDDMKIYAKKIVALEQSGVKPSQEIPPSLRSSIDENAK